VLRPLLSFPTRAEFRKLRISGRRVHLVPLEALHAAPLWEAVERSRDTIEPWLPWVPFVTDLEAATRFVTASSADWDAGKALRMVIQTNNSHTFCGVVSLEQIQQPHRNCDLGYWITPNVVGYGIMVETLKTLLPYAFDEVGMHRIRVAAGTGNERSLKVIERMNFRYEGEAREAEYCNSKWLDHKVFAKLDTDPR
jgi:ribosomal-protein-serine acetyltransferase